MYFNFAKVICASIIFFVSSSMMQDLHGKVSTKSKQHSPISQIHVTNSDFAYSQGITGKNVSIAVIDTGILMEHTKLKDNILKQYAHNTVDKKFPKEVYDQTGHGTHVAAIAAGLLPDRKFYNGIDMHGIAFNAKIIPIRAISHSDTLASESIAEGINYATDTPADIINISLGIDGKSPSVYKALKKATKKNKMITISTGNKNKLEPGIPASYANDPEMNNLILAVTSIGPTAHRSFFSTENNEESSANACGKSKFNCVAIPGLHVLSADNFDNTSMAYRSGTSMSAPAVAGILALLKEAFPSLDNKDIIDRLLRTSFDPYNMSRPCISNTKSKRNPSNIYGCGIPDVQQALLPIGKNSAISVHGDKAILYSIDDTFISGSGIVGTPILNQVDLENIYYMDDYGVLFTSSFNSNIDNNRIFFNDHIYVNETSLLNDKYNNAIKFPNLSLSGISHSKNSPIAFTNIPDLSSEFTYQLKLANDSNLFLNKLTYDNNHFLMTNYAYNYNNMISGNFIHALLHETDSILGDNLSGAFSNITSSNTHLFGIKNTIFLGNITLSGNYFLGKTNVNVAKHEGFLYNFSQIYSKSGNITLSISNILNKNDNITIEYLVPIRIISGYGEVLLPLTTKPQYASLSNTLHKNSIMMSYNQNFKNLSVSFGIAQNNIAEEIQNFYFFFTKILF